MVRVHPGSFFTATHRCANGRAARLKPERLRVRLPPLPLKTRVGWALACPSGCNPPAFRQCRFNSCPTHLKKENSARSSIGSGRQPLTLQRRVRFPHGSLSTLEEHDQVVQLVDTRRSERRAHTGLGVRLSPWSLVMRCRCGWRPTGSHKAGLSGSIPGPATEIVIDAGGPVPSEGS